MFAKQTMNGGIHKGKRRFLRLVMFFCALGLSPSCETPDRQTSELKQYLEKNFNLSVKTGDLYLFIPSTQCDSLFAFDGNKISASLNKRLHIFSSSSPIHVKSFLNYHHDKDEKLKDLLFTGYSSQLVCFENNKITAVAELASF